MLFDVEGIIFKNQLLKMEKVNPLALILVLTGIIFYVGGIIQAKWPPKKINHFYGFRTSTSMRNQEIWEFAQQYSSDKIQKLGGYTILLGVLAFFINFHQMWAIWVGIALVTLLPVLMIIQIEKELKNRFPKE